ncbi:MAG TPA: VOC family protein [Vicinamibacterales bacterium]|jgi:catechol 2,3-dioxygenase-like lactoylglutathione lyase family enzyme|nr:VOC family protein [Vicinamibacterales bacterium]
MQIGTHLRLAVVTAVLIAAFAPRASAQLLNKDAPIVVGHFHMEATSVAEHRKFWVDTLGGTAEKIGNADVVRFPGILLFFEQKKPSGPNRGTAFDHIGFAVPDVPALTTRIVAAGYTLTSGREPVPGKEAAAAQGTQPPYGRFSYILGPDGTKVELVTSAEKTPARIAYHHIHFINKQYVEMRNWYARALNATERTGPNTFTDYFAGADLPGVGYSLNFFRWEGDQSVTHVPTKGRATDHVGFEVRNLPAFVKELEAKGIKLTEGYKKSNKAMGGVATAMIADPWGVQIELTEGLR